MSTANYSINHNAIASGSAGDGSARSAVLKTDEGYVVASAANRTLYGRRADGIALENFGAGKAFRIAHDGLVDEVDSGLPDGAQDDYVIVASDGTLSRTASPGGGDDIIGTCPGTNGDFHLRPGSSLGGGDPPVADDVAKSGGPGTAINRVQGIHGRPISTTAPKMGQRYLWNDDEEEWQAADQVIHVDLFGADPTGVADSALAIENAITYLGATGGGTLLFSPTPNGAYYRLSRMVNVVCSVVLKGQGSAYANAFAGTKIMCEKSGFHIWGGGFTGYPSGAPDTVVEDLLVLATSKNTNSQLGAVTAGSNLVTLAAAGDFANDDVIAFEGTGIQYPLQHIEAYTTNGSALVKLVTTGDQDANVALDWYMTIVGAFAAPTRVIDVADIFTPGAAYVVGDLIFPGNSTSGHKYRCTVAGTAGAEPVWPTNGTTIATGGATFEDLGKCAAFYMASNASGTVTAGIAKYCAPTIARIMSGGGTVNLVTDSTLAITTMASTRITHADTAFLVDNVPHFSRVAVGDSSSDFQGAGMTWRGNLGDTTAKNMNCARLVGYRSTYNRFGLFVQGGDANAGVVIGVNSVGAREWGLVEGSHLGNSYYGCHFSGGFGIITQDLPGHQSKIDGCYAEQGTICSFGEGTITDGGTMPSFVGGMNFGRGTINRCKLGHLTYLNTETHFGEEDIFWRAKQTGSTGSVAWCRKDVSTNTNAGNWQRISHELGYRNHPICISDQDLATCKVGTLHFPQGFLLGDDPAENNIDLAQAVRVMAIKADTAQSGGPVHRDPPNGHFDTGTNESSGGGYWRKGDLVADRNMTDGDPMRVIVVDGHGALTYAAGTSYAQNNVVRPTRAQWTGFYYTKTSVGSVVSTSEPAWNTTIGASFTDDDSITWRCEGNAAWTQPIELGGDDRVAISGDVTWTTSTRQFYARNVRVKGFLSAPATITLPTFSGERYFWNDTLGGQDLVIEMGADSVTIANGEGRTVLALDGRLVPKSASTATGVTPSAALVDLPLTGFWRTPYAGTSPHPGTASAGTSGARSLTEATNPPAAGAGGSFDFVPTDKFQYTGTDGDLIGTGEFYAHVLFDADAATADAGAGSRYLNPQFITDGASALFGIGFSSAGVHVMYHDGAGHKERVLACGTGAKHCVQVTQIGTTLKMRLDRGAWTTIATSGVYGGGAGTPVRFGVRYDSAAPYDGEVFEWVTGKFGTSDAIADAILDDVNAFHGTSF